MAGTGSAQHRATAVGGPTPPWTPSTPSMSFAGTASTKRRRRWPVAPLAVRTTLLGSNDPPEPPSVDGWVLLCALLGGPGHHLFRRGPGLFVEISVGSERGHAHAATASCGSTTPRVDTTSSWDRTDRWSPGPLSWTEEFRSRPRRTWDWKGHLA